MIDTALIQQAPAPDDWTALSDTELALCAQGGDLEAFNQLVIQYQARIYRLTLKIVGDEAAAEDITQNTFLSAYRRLSTFHGGSLRSWLFRIATNLCYDELRRRKRHPLQAIQEDEAGISVDPYLDRSMLPEQAYEARELERAVQQAVDQLDIGLRTVVILVDLHSLDYSEAARVLGIPLGTVKSRLARARVRLQSLLDHVYSSQVPV